jgi:adenylate cyclase
LNYVIDHYNHDLHSSIAFAYGQDPKVVCLSQAAWTTWLRGYPEQAQMLNNEAIALARKLSHPYTLAAALDFGAMIPQLCGNDRLVGEYAEEAIAVSSQREFALWKPWALLMQGWAMTQRGQFSGIAQIRDGIAAFRTTGADVMVPYFLGLLAEAYGKAGDTGEALKVIAEAQALVERGHERWWEPELYRLKGEITLALANNSEDSESKSRREAEECFLQALNIASRQRAKSLELRTVMSLCRLWQRQDKKHEACRMLADVYNWFEEGFETADLLEGKTLLD